MHWTHNVGIFDKIQHAQVTRNVSWKDATDELGVAQYTRDDDDGDDDENYDNDDDDNNNNNNHFSDMVTSQESTESHDTTEMTHLKIIESQLTMSDNVTAKPNLQGISNVHMYFGNSYSGRVTAFSVETTQWKSFINYFLTIKNRTMSGWLGGHTTAVQSCSPT
jgi:hypothetical protein